MPKIVKIRRPNPPNLLEDFKSYEINARSGDTPGSASQLVYTGSREIKLWTRFDSDAPKNLITTSAVNSLAYSGGGNTETSFVYNSQMKTALFTSGSGAQASRSAVVTFPSVTNVTTFGGGSAASQAPFSVSLWFKKNEPQGTDATDDHFFAKGLVKSSATYDNSEYAALLHLASGKLVFYLADASSQSLQYVESTSGTELLTDFNTWHHIAFTYDGTPGNSSDANTANAGMKIYLDGELHATTQKRVHAGSGYLGMERKSNKLFIGSNDGGVSGDADLIMAEFAIWAKELSPTEVKAIYHWTHENSVVKSGYLDNSYRIKLRERDNTPNCYPTHHRMGDKDRSGKRNIFFDDKSLNFKNTIFDDFSKNLNSNVVDTNSWVVSNGIIIKNNENSDQELIDRCAVFQGEGTLIPGSGLKRFIRSKNKIINPVKFNFEVVRGNYNLGNNTLNLKYRSDPDNEFKLSLQISTDSNFLTPTTIVTASFKEGIYDFYNAIDNNPIKEPRGKKYSLTLKDFPNLGGSYYFRFVQDTYASNEANWAIRSIDVEYYDGQVNYPLLVDSNNDKVGIDIRKRSITSQNIMSTLSGSGRLVQGISDVVMPYAQKTENISPFNDESVNEEKENNFFQGGTPESVYPGFSWPTTSKTKFTIDLSPSEETTFGHTTRLTLPEDPDQSNYVAKETTANHGDESGNGQNLMVYWNSDLKKWQKIGQPVNFNNHATPTEELLFQNLTQSCLGFSRHQLIGTGSGTAPYKLNSIELYPKNQHALNSKPFDRYFFPFGGQYHATSSQYILAKDIGITKPFLLEKITINCDLKLELPISSSSTFYSHENLMLFSKFESNVPVNINSIKAITPTFFLLRQFKDNATFKRKIRRKSSLTDVTLEYEASIPGNYYLNSGSLTTTYVDDSRELITYAQPTFFVTGTHFENEAGATSQRSGIGHMTHSVQDLIEAGIGSDKNFIINHTHTSSFSHTASISINAPVRNIAKYPRGLIFRHNRKLGGFSIKSKAHYYSGKESTSRSDSSLKSSRGIVNGIAASDSDEVVIIENGVTTIRNTLAAPTADTIERTSPYLINPNDKLILGWQYPFINRSDYAFGYPGTDSNAFNSMTLFGRSKLHLYGSEVVQNKEFHETTNQNLTTCAVYEHVIGNEKVIDQWQLAYRGELTGSIYSQYMVNVVSAFDDNSNPQIYPGAYLQPYYTHKNAAEQLKTNYRISDFEKLAGMGKNLLETADFPNPAKRIGLKTLSAFGGSSTLFNFLRPFYGSDAAANNVVDILYSLRVAAATNAVNLKDQFRIYVDSRKFKGDFYDDSSYGTKTGLVTPNVANGTGLFQFGTVRERERLFQDHYPKAYYSTKHFGHYADMIRQGLDGNMTFKPTSGIYSEFTFGEILEMSQPAVKAQFVETVVDELTGVKTYPNRSINSYMESYHFQSSNLNTAMTSSMPFIDDDEPKNRTYLPEDTEVDTTS